MQYMESGVRRRWGRARLIRPTSVIERHSSRRNCRRVEHSTHLCSAPRPLLHQFYCEGTSCNEFSRHKNLLTAWVRYSPSSLTWGFLGKGMRNRPLSVREWFCCKCRTSWRSPLEVLQLPKSTAKCDFQWWQQKSSKMWRRRSTCRCLLLPRGPSRSRSQSQKVSWAYRSASFDTWLERICLFWGEHQLVRFLAPPSTMLRSALFDEMSHMQAM